MAAVSLARICRALIRHYPTDGWWPSRSRFETMLGAILVQNTRWPNAARAIEQLRDESLLHPDRLAGCPTIRLTELIRPAGCQRVKVRRLQSLARQVVKAGGLRRLAAADTAQLRAGLLSVHGIGPETADAMLCFAFERPVFVADAYARRFIDRVGFAGVPSGAAAGAYERCRAWAESRLSRWTTESLQHAHAALVLHGQRHCSRRPSCPDCPVRHQCNYILNQ